MEENNRKDLLKKRSGTPMNIIVKDMRAIKPQRKTFGLVSSREDINLFLYVQNSSFWCTVLHSFAFVTDNLEAQIPCDVYILIVFNFILLAPNWSSKTPSVIIYLISHPKVSKGPE